MCGGRGSVYLHSLWQQQTVAQAAQVSSARCDQDSTESTPSPALHAMHRVLRLAAYTAAQGLPPHNRSVARPASVRTHAAAHPRHNAPHLLLESLTLFPKMMCRPPKRARSARPIVFVANLFFASLTKRPADLLPDPISRLS